MSDHAEIPESACILAMLMTPGVGVVTLNRIAAALKEAKTPLRAVIGQSQAVLQKGLSTGLEWTFEPLSHCETATVERAKFLYNRVHKTGAQWIAYRDSDYPEPIRQAMEYQAPPLLTVHGDSQLLAEPGIAIVGSRDPSKRGLLLAGELAQWCAARNTPVISGGAPGIDLTAHEAVLKAGGRSVFILPQGILTYKGPRWLQKYIDSGHAAVVSQSIPDAEWTTSAALARNRTIAAFARLIGVLDPGQTGGSRRTGGHGIEYARRTLVYAYDKLNSGYTDLIREGAYPVLNETGDWDDGYLENHWVQGGHAEPGQVDLF
ncbi:MAG: DNA-processing protein DprA [Candidatus Hydrogenedentota bacterium]